MFFVVFCNVRNVFDFIIIFQQYMHISRNLFDLNAISDRFSEKQHLISPSTTINAHDIMIAFSFIDIIVNKINILSTKFNFSHNLVINCKSQNAFLFCQICFFIFYYKIYALTFLFHEIEKSIK